tara:strand:+ start:444 stop:1019 length:576 start_codon:yes stop_codon:yes gene_type:complete
MTYDFSGNTESDITPMIFTIGTLGNDLVGMELGVEAGDSFLTMLHSCPNIKTLYGVDNYKPHQDMIYGLQEQTDEKDSKLHQFVANHRIKYSGMSEKAVLFEEDSNETIKKFKPESLDFIFIDTYMTYDQAINDIRSWYPIIKNGGLFAGHDWRSDIVKTAVYKVRDEIEPDAVVFHYANCWGWMKNINTN